MKKINIRTALIISIFGGYLGLDKFYQGNYKLGFIKLITLGGYGIWWIIDIYMLYKSQKKDIDVNIPKGFKNILKPILYVLGIPIGLSIILILYFTILAAFSEPNNTNIIDKKEVEIIPIKEELNLEIKKNIYYLYWQVEHIASLKTIEKYGDLGNQDERDDFFKNTRLEYEKILSEKEGIDLDVYTKNVIEISGEGDKNNWKKPNSEDDNVIKYVYSETKYNNIIKEREINIAFIELKKSDNLWMQCQMYIKGDGFLSKFKYAKFKKINDLKVNVYSKYTGKNGFGQKVTQEVVCKYKYNDKYRKYEIAGVDL